MKRQWMVLGFCSLLASMSFAQVPADLNISLTPVDHVSALPITDAADLDEYRLRAEGRSVLFFDFADNSQDTAILVDSGAQLIAGRAQGTYMILFNRYGQLQRVHFQMVKLDQNQEDGVQYGLTFSGAGEEGITIPLQLVQAIGSFDPSQGALALYRSIVGSGQGYYMLYAMPAGPAYVRLDGGQD